ncbi:MAG TPA: DUF3488 and transglutaminase-like domain-containing protein [Candidatus Competibacteraceae bacterium]|nr:DUF3488 and transglutaminase-like domain-containing protein [Candidatus Competibacteraceae bacterium]
MIGRWRRAPGAVGAVSEIGRDVLLGLLPALALVLLPHLAHLPWWSGPLFLAAALWRWGVAAWRWPLPPRLLLVLLTLAVGTGVALGRGTLLGRDAGVALLVGMTALKLLECRCLRDLRVLSLLGYLLVMANLLYSQSLAMAGYLVLAATLLLAAQLRLDPAHTALAPGAALRLAGRIMLQTLPVMLVLFVLFPRIPGPLWTLPRDAHSGRTGLDERMAPGSISKLSLSDEVAFRVRFAGAPPASERLYWRGPVLWNYDGLAWSAGEDYPQREALARIQPLGEAVDYSVILEPHGKRWLYALDLPTGLPEDGALSASFQLLRVKPVEETLRYQVRSHLQYHTDGLNAWERRRALLLPEGANPRTRALAAQWHGQYAIPAQRVQAALALFREQPFRYTLEPPLLPTRDGIDAFLFGTRAGFCEHYAGAFVFLMRAAGVPARVVTGYQGGELNRFGGYLMVRQADAHAWAEVWLEGQGWVRVDPTAAVSPARVERGLYGAVAERDALGFMARRDGSAWLRQLALTWDSVDNLWTEWVLAYGPEQQQAFLSELSGMPVRWAEMVTALVVLLGLLGMVYAAAWWWRCARPRDDELGRVWRRFCARLGRRGLPRRADEGPLDYAERVARARPELAEAVRRIARLYAHLRYGPAPREQDLRVLRRWMAELRI